MVAARKKTPKAMRFGGPSAEPAHGGHRRTGQDAIGSMRYERSFNPALRARF